MVPVGAAATAVPLALPGVAESNVRSGEGINSEAASFAVPTEFALRPTAKTDGRRSRRTARMTSSKATVKGSEPAFIGLGYRSPCARRMHRPARVRSISSPQSSRNLGPDWEKLDAKKLENAREPRQT